MREIQVILHDNPAGKIDVMYDPVLTTAGESVVWHFTSLDPQAAQAVVTFKNAGNGGQFFAERGGGKRNYREVSLTNGIGHTLAVAPDDPPKYARKEKYDIEFKDNKGNRLAFEDPEIVVKRP